MIIEKRQEIKSVQVKPLIMQRQQEFNKRELRTIMNALKLQLETYRKIESQENINEEDLANVIMDRGYTESLLDAIEND